MTYQPETSTPSTCTTCGHRLGLRAAPRLRALARLGLYRLSAGCHADVQVEVSDGRVECGCTDPAHSAAETA